MTDLNIRRKQRLQPAIQEEPDRCARPMCRSVFTRQLGRGRPQYFCTEECRRAAERELRQARSRLAHFEQLVDQCRMDVAAFTRGADVDSGGGDTSQESPATNANGTGVSPQDRQQAREALSRAAGALAFVEGDSANPLAQEFRRLHDGVAPAVNSL